jgi:hypothetical protein
MRDSDVQREIDNMTEKRANPFSVAQEQYEARWDMIFGRDKGDKERDKAFDKREEALAEVQRLGQEIQPDMEIDK